MKIKYNTHTQTNAHTLNPEFPMIDTKRKKERNPKAHEPLSRSSHAVNSGDVKKLCHWKYDQERLHGSLQRRRHRKGEEHEADNNRGLFPKIESLRYENRENPHQFSISPRKLDLFPGKSVDQKEWLVSLTIDLPRHYTCFYANIYPIARSVRVQAIVAAVAAAGKLPTVQERMWLRPEIVEAAPTTPASNANVTKNPVAAFPIGK